MSSQLYLCLGGTGILCSFVWQALSLYTATTKATLIISSLPNSPALTSGSTVVQFGLVKKIMWINGISTALRWPRGYLKRGELNIEDLLNFPTRLRRQLVALRMLIECVGLIMIVLLIQDPWVLLPNR